MATNRQAVLTTVSQVPDTNFININRTVALTADTATFPDLYKLYLDLESVLVDFAITTDEYKMAQAYFAGTGGSGYFYIVPVRTGIAPAYNVSATLTLLENDPTITFAMVTADKSIRVATEILTNALATAKYKKPYHMLFETNDVTTKAVTTTDPVSVNKAFYDGLTGDDAKLIGNMSFVYIETADDYQASAICGAMMGSLIGQRTAKFIKPSLSTPITLTSTELQYLMDKNCNVYTGTNEVTGRAFVKEGIAVKAESYIDTSLGAIWVEVNLNSACYDLFNANKVSIDGAGFALLENATKPIFIQGQTNGIIQAGDSSFSISFAAGTGREIIGTYSFFESVSGHFVTNNVAIK